MKKVFAFMLSLMLLISCTAIIPATAEGKKINIVTTIFPIYDWTRETVGNEADKVNISILLDNGVDLHSYQPTAQDILSISNADLFIYVGGESDEWVEGVLKSAMNPDLKAINLVEAMGDEIKMEETVEGMEHEHHHDHEDHDDDHDHDEEHDEDHDEDHDHEHEHDEDHEHEDHDEDHDHDEEHEHDEDHDHEHEHEHEHEDEADEHVWLSLCNAKKLTMVIAETLAEIDPDSADAYRGNAAAYAEKLDNLDAQYTEMVNGSAYKTILFGDRFPFRYLADDYGLDYYAAFSGCSAESEASFATIIFLAQKVDELGLPAVLTIENPKTKIAETVVQSTTAKNQKILSLDSLQGTTAQDIQSGKTYLSVMEANLNVLKEALN